MNLNQFCQNTKISVATYEAVISAIINKVGTTEIIETLNVSQYFITKITSFYLAQKGANNMHEMSKQYWKDEQEMIIQEYNGSDLTGWELEVFNGKN